MRKFSIRPTLTIKGRKFNGLRGWAGKPTHPPLTDFPVAAYIMAAAFDIISCFGSDQRWSVDFYRAGTLVLISGGIVSVLTALTGFLDWWQTTEKGSQARRTANTHAVVMLTVTALVVVNIIVRLNDYSDRSSPSAGILILSIVVALLVSFGATFGGTLVYDYGFNVENSNDSPVFHPSETDILPGAHKEG
jgi:uncharacterized membrane protein